MPMARQLALVSTYTSGDAHNRCDAHKWVATTGYIKQKYVGCKVSYAETPTSSYEPSRYNCNTH